MLIKVFSLIAMAVITLGCNASTYLTSDKKMQDNFLKNETDFNKLIEMFKNEDTSITFISKEKYPFQKKLSDERFNEYKKLLNKANLPYGIDGFNTFGGNKTITFSVDSKDLAGQWNKEPYDEFDVGEKGYAYSTEELAPLVDSLDKITDEELKEKSYFFKKIKDNWYLFYSCGVRKPE